MGSKLTLKWDIQLPILKEAIRGTPNSARDKALS
jgi:hypothetical protein